MNRKTIGIAVLIGLPIVLLVVALIIRNVIVNRNTFNIAKFVLVSVEGFDHRAVANATLDTVGLEKAIQINHNDKEADVKKFVETVSYTIDKQEGLSNGDKINIEVDFDKELAKKLSIVTKHMTRTVDVAGLTEGQELDVFKDVKVITGGISPYIYATCDNRTDNEYLKTVQYSVDKSTGLSIGDEITISCEADDVRAAEYGYFIDKKQMKYVISTADKYVGSLEEFGKEYVNKLGEANVEVATLEIEDTTSHISYKITGDRNYLFRDNNEKAKSVEYLGSVFAYNNSGREQKHENSLITVVKAVISMPNYSGSEDPYDYLEGYFGYMYFDAIIKSDGELTLATNDPEKRCLYAASYEGLLEKINSELGKEYKMSDTITE